MRFAKIALFLILTSGAVLLIVGSGKFSLDLSMTKEKTDLVSQDGKNLSAFYYPASNSRGWVIFTHMMPATKESWDDLAEILQDAGYNGLALDLRGHGESEGGPDGYKNFTDTEHQAGIKDLDAAWRFLKEKGAVPEKTAVIGASIGANLAFQFLTLHPEIKKGVFLSAGNYKGLDSASLVKKLASDQGLVFAASKQDIRSAGNNAEQNQQYYNLASQVKNRHLILFDGAGHGTELFQLKEELDLAGVIKQFLENGSIN